MTTFAVTSVNSLLCHASTCFRIGSKFRCIRSTPTEIASTSENDFECLASTGVKAPRNAKEVRGKKEQHSRSKPDAPRSGVLPALPQGVGKVSPPMREEVWHAARPTEAYPA